MRKFMGAREKCIVCIAGHGVKVKVPVDEALKRGKFFGQCCAINL